MMAVITLCPMSSGVFNVVEGRGVSPLVGNSEARWKVFVIFSKLDVSDPLIGFDVSSLTCSNFVPDGLGSLMDEDVNGEYFCPLV